jgi:predicted CDP-diglyceride synthetase/phosphatidate cytidylyltransferase
MLSLPHTLAFALLALLFGFIGVLFYRLVQRPDNELDWTELVASHGKLNHTKVGYWIGALGGLWVIVTLTLTNHFDATAFIGWLGFLGGVMVLSGMAGKDRPKVDDPDGGN